MPSVPMVRGCVAGIQLNGPSEFLAGRIKIPIEAIQAECKRVVGFAERTIQFKSFDRGSLCFGEGLLWSQHGILPVSQQSIGVSQTGISRRVFRVFVDCLIEIGQGNLQAIRGSLVPEEASFEI